MSIASAATNDAALHRPLPAAELQLDTLRHPTLLRSRDVLWIAAALGLTAGCIESAFWGIKRSVLGAFTYVHVDIFWMAPLAYAVLFVAAAAPFAWIVRRVQHPAICLCTIVFLSMAAAQCVLLLFPQVHVIAAWLVTIGVATQAGRWFQRRPLQARLAARCAAMVLSVVVAVIAAAEVGERNARESRALASLPPAAAKAPNVLLIVLDTVRADALGAYGADGNPTPRFDALAERGTLFEHAISPAPWTLPATASLMTGRLPNQLSADWLTPLDDRHRTLAESLRNRGYATAGFVANYKYATAETGLDRGFTHYDAHSHNVAEFAACTAAGRALFFSHALPNLGCYADPVRRPAREINERFLAWTAEQRTRPYFAFLNYLDVHDPYAAPAPFNRHPPANAQERLLLRFWWFLRRDTLTASEASLARDAYTDCLKSLDHELGRLMDALEARGELSNTVVVVTADHGEHFGEHGLYLHGNSLYQPLIHVPLLIAAPGRVPEGRRVAQPVSTADLAATIDELTGGTRPEFPGRPLPLHGPSSPREDRPRPIISEVLTPPVWAPCQGISPIFRGSMRSVRLENLKYICNDDGSEELFDIGIDPQETENIVLRPERQADLAALRAALQTGR